MNQQVTPGIAGGLSEDAWGTMPDSQSGFEDVAREDVQFRFRGQQSNRLVDAAIPLLGLVLRIHRLAHFDRVPALYDQVVDDVAAVDRELIEEGYERATVVAYRYVLCAFIDEAVLGTEWGSNSLWSQRSLLSRFHNETWGGEKVFAILARMQQEQERYRDMLAFIHLCLCLGFEGRYKVRDNGRNEYSEIVRGLQRQLESLEGTSAGETLTSPMNNVVPARNRLRRGFGLWGIAGVMVFALCGIYSLYSVALDARIRDVISVLDQLPK